MSHLCLHLLLQVLAVKFITSDIQCEEKNVLVEMPTLVPFLSSKSSIATWFCWKRNTELSSQTIIHLTIHGYTYDHTYWSFPYQAANYSYVDYIIEQSAGGIAVLNIDRIGVGLSSRPSIALDVTIDSNAHAIYQLTEQLYHGAYRNIPFQRIILVTHSLGTLITWIVASNYIYNQYICGLILTGWLHALNPIGFTATTLSNYPVQLDAKFTGHSLPLGYFTTKHSHQRREYLFYNSKNADRQVMTLDEQLKQTGTLGELLTVPVTAVILERSLMIPSRMPILVVIGQNDFIFCDFLDLSLSCENAEALKRREAPKYSARIETFVLPRSGHNINLHLNAHQWYERAFNWTQRHFHLQTKHSGMKEE